MLSIEGALHPEQCTQRGRGRAGLRPPPQSSLCSSNAQSRQRRVGKVWAEWHQPSPGVSEADCVRGRGRLQGSVEAAASGWVTPADATSVMLTPMAQAVDLPQTTAPSSHTGCRRSGEVGGSSQHSVLTFLCPGQPSGRRAALPRPRRGGPPRDDSPWP